MTDKPDGMGLTADLVIRSEWAELEGYYKVLTATAVNKTFGQTASVVYLVPGGKTLYITTLMGTALASLAADADNNQMCFVEFYAPNVATLQSRWSANGGNVIPLSQPIKVAEGGLFIATITNYSNHAQDLSISARGWER